MEPRPDACRTRSKTDWRRHVLAERRALDQSVRAAENEALVGFVTSAVTPGSTVCAYAPTASEPGSTELLDALRSVADRVLLPVTRGEGPLWWAPYEGVDALVPAEYGLREPAGPALDPDEIGRAATIFVPALAVDRRGVRLGRGAGFYDRTLVSAGAATRIIALVRDAELIAELPEDFHDVRMGWALTPHRGLVRLDADDTAPRREWE